MRNSGQKYYPCGVRLQRMPGCPGSGGDPGQMKASWITGHNSRTGKQVQKEVIMSPQQQEASICVFIYYSLTLLLLPLISLPSHLDICWFTDPFENQMEETQGLSQDKCAHRQKSAYNSNFMDVCLWSLKLTLSFGHCFSGWHSVGLSPLSTDPPYTLNPNILLREDLIDLVPHYSVSKALMLSPTWH